MGFRVPSQGCGFRLRFDNFDPFVRTLEPGDALVHHCQTIHYSSPNKTDHPCCGLLLGYRGIAHNWQKPKRSA